MCELEKIRRAHREWGHLIYFCIHHSDKQLLSKSTYPPSPQYDICKHHMQMTLCDVVNDLKCVRSSGIVLDLSPSSSEPNQTQPRFNAPRALNTQLQNARLFNSRSARY